MKYKLLFSIVLLSSQISYANECGSDVAMCGDLPEIEITPDKKSMPTKLTHRDHGDFGGGSSDGRNVGDGDINGGGGGSGSNGPRSNPGLSPSPNKNQREPRNPCSQAARAYNKNGYFCEWDWESYSYYCDDNIDDGHKWQLRVNDNSQCVSNEFNSPYRKGWF